MRVRVCYKQSDRRWLCRYFELTVDDMRECLRTDPREYVSCLAERVCLQIAEEWARQTCVERKRRECVETYIASQCEGYISLIHDAIYRQLYDMYHAVLAREEG